VALRSGIAPAEAVELTLNARVQVTPEALQSIVERAVRGAAADAGITAEFSTLQSLSPGRPEPIHRYTRVVG
jgi:hypothetical protein